MFIRPPCMHALKEILRHAKQDNPRRMSAIHFGLPGSPEHLLHPANRHAELGEVVNLQTLKALL